MKTMARLFLALLALITLAACSTQDTDDEGAQRLVEQFLQSVHEGDYDKAFSLASPEFFNVRSEKEWRNYFDNIQAKLGKLEKLKLKQKLSDVRLSGHFYIYQFANKYEKGLAKEMVTIVQKVDADDPLGISSYRIDSSKLQ